ncbi:MAG: O-antigen ligase family protein, partial [Proteobacteria bacterium]|nr:O-antigen ligase family protein [Pseudomonadota bacterium]
MTKYLKRLSVIIKQDPIVFVMGLGIILLAVMGTSVRHVSSAMFALLFLLSLSVIMSWPKVFSSLTKLEKLLVLSFVLYTVSGLLSYYNVDDVDKYIKLLERYFRFLIAIPILLLMIKKNTSLMNCLYIGAALSGPFLFVIALNHYLQYPDQPAKGYYHHIIFAQLAMVNVGIMIVYLITNDLRRMVQFGLLVSISCGLAAVIFSQARGAWIVFPVYLFVAFMYLFKNGKLRLNTVIALLVLTATMVSVTPIGDLIKTRTDAAYSEVTAFYNDGEYATSVGARLAMWDIALDVWKQHPVLG